MSRDRASARCAVRLRSRNVVVVFVGRCGGCSAESLAHAVGIGKQRYRIVSCVMNVLGRCFAEDVGGSFCSSLLPFGHIADSLLTAVSLVIAALRYSREVFWMCRVSVDGVVPLDISSTTEAEQASSRLATGAL
jgi:hypothetical protein